jgi:hypothetical protein
MKRVKNFTYIERLGKCKRYLDNMLQAKDGLARQRKVKFFSTG